MAKLLLGGYIRWRDKCEFRDVLLVRDYSYLYGKTSEDE